MKNGKSLKSYCEVIVDNKAPKERNKPTINLRISQARNRFEVVLCTKLCNSEKKKKKKFKMIDIKNSSTDYLQRTSGTFNNISMLFAGNFHAIP